jgi:L-threonylcarbamoyladenylate synthase
MNANIVPPTPETIGRAADLLRAGKLIAFPTETVYGLGGDATDDRAVARIYAAKGRPRFNPLIVHVPDLPAAEAIAEFSARARDLARRFWPGPLTLVLRRAAGVADQLTGGQDTIGLRIPGHPIALELLRVFGGGIAAPSANKFGRISPTTAEHVRNDLGEEVDLILDGGPCEIGIESTIVDLSRDRPVLLRPGRVSTEDIAAALGATPEPRDRNAPRAPGALESHYAPRKPLRLVAAGQWDDRVRSARRNCAVLSFRARPAGEKRAMWIRASADPQRYARDLYSNLRALDASGCDEILVEEPPASAEWAAVRDRLARARLA